MNRDFLKSDKAIRDETLRSYAIEAENSYVRQELQAPMAGFSSRPFHPESPKNSQVFSILYNQSPSPQKPTLALVTDTDDWAFANIARQLERLLSPFYNVFWLPSDPIGNIVQTLLLTQEADLVHFFWRYSVDLIQSEQYYDYLLAAGIDIRRFEQEILRSNRISTGVYDHLGLGPEELRQLEKVFNQKAVGYYCGSQRLFDIYKNIPGYKPPVAVLPDGVDLRLFKPQNLERLQDRETREAVIGWSGNSQWSGSAFDFKGLHSILRPAINQLRSEGFVIREHFADSSVERRALEDMPLYYSEIDLFVCCSQMEGGPNGVLEAMACGVPVVSTDVGVVPEVFGPRQKRFLLQERSVACMVETLRELLVQRDLLAQLSEENLDSIRVWDWTHRTTLFLKYFDSLLAKRGKYREEGAVRYREIMPS